MAWKVNHLLFKKGFNYKAPYSYETPSGFSILPLPNSNQPLCFGLLNRGLCMRNVICMYMFFLHFSASEKSGFWVGMGQYVYGLYEAPSHIRPVPYRWGITVVVWIMYDFVKRVELCFCDSSPFSLSLFLSLCVIMSLQKLPNKVWWLAKNAKWMSNTAGHHKHIIFWYCCQRAVYALYHKQSTSFAFTDLIKLIYDEYCCFCVRESK